MSVFNVEWHSVAQALWPAKPSTNLAVSGSPEGLRHIGIRAGNLLRKRTLRAARHAAPAGNRVTGAEIRGRVTDLPHITDMSP